MCKPFLKYNQPFMNFIILYMWWKFPIIYSIVAQFFLFFKGIPSSQIGSAWEWYHWIGLEKDINHYRIFVFLFWSWILYMIRVQSSEPLHAKMNQTSCLFGSWLHVLKPLNRTPKMRERYQLFFGLRLIRIPTFCNPNKSAPANRKTGFYVNRDPNKQEVGSIF